MDIAVNYVAVVVAAVVSYLVGAWWHSPLGFQKMWMGMMGFDEHSMKDMPLTAGQAMGLGFVVTLLQAFVLALFLSWLQVVGWEQALQAGFWVWLGFLAPTLANGWLWEGKTFKLFVFNAVYSLVSIEVMAVVLALWV